MSPGRYIAFEGGDSCGKSTQSRLLATKLDAVLTREPGGTRIGAALRDIVLDPANRELGDRTEALLYAADRAQHADEVLRPTLAAGRHVVSDRSVWSSVVYQGDGRQLGVDPVMALSEFALAGCWPDLVVLLDLAPAVARKRLSRSLDRVEQADGGFHERVRDGYRRLAATAPDHWVVLDAGASVDQVAAAVRAAVSDRLGL